MAQRHREIDLLRTVAIVLMVIYHVVYDLQVFFDQPLHIQSPFWEYWRISTVSLFLGVAGVSSHFSRFPVRRAITVLLAAGLVSLGTYVFDPDTFVYFGILHCIGLGLLLARFLRPLREWNILLGSTLIIFQDYVSLFTLHFSLFSRPTLDFYPPIPWFGILLIGAGLGHFLYRRHHWKPSLPIPTALTLPGKHALIIYLVHQPIILVVLWLYSLMVL